MVLIATGGIEVTTDAVTMGAALPALSFSQAFLQMLPGASPLILSRLLKASYPQRLEIEDKMEQKKSLGNGVRMTGG